MSWLEWLTGFMPSDEQGSAKGAPRRSKTRSKAVKAAAKAPQQASLFGIAPSRKSQALTSQEHIQLSHEILPYTLVRKPRRNVGLRIDSSGLTVNAAIGTPLSMIESFVRKHEAWVLKKLEVWKAREVTEVQWAAQTPLQLRGDTIMLHWDIAKSSPVKLDELGVHIGEPRFDRIAARVTQWLKREATIDFAQRAQRICQQFDIALPRLMLSSAKHRWGSCNSKREVRLNWRLIQAAPEVIEYVICHELAHLKHMNHSARFWAEVARMCPDYQRLRKQLQDIDHQLKRL
jgi:predicted metal-dependent hydrolase